MRSSKDGSGDHAKHYFVNEGEVMDGLIHRGPQGSTFMCCKSCWEVACLISGASGTHSYKVISDELPTTNLFSPRGCHSKRLSEGATI
jgi:hypothetical protein